MKRALLFFAFTTYSLMVFSQSNILFTNTEAANVFAGNYNTSSYNISGESDPHIIAAELTDRISEDSLKSYLIRMNQFETRHTSSDTHSLTRGFGAARRWSFQKFESFNQSNGGKLLVSYLQFDRNICGVTQHRNILAVLPGSDNTADPLIIEGHLDSRCDQVCDTNCIAQGMEDNASGSALVLELARVMSAYQFPRTILFMLTTGEEQGLYGAEALANYCQSYAIRPAVVLNNDVIGGIICGETSSEPSCPGLNHIDSTQVRIFSAGGFASPHKQLARYVKLEYLEELLPHTRVAQEITIMSNEDRIGRGGDHIPFRQNGYRAIRFTSANEHGDAGVGPGYEDRQHTSDDLLGLDTDNDGQIDSFFVDFNYLARNAAINANAATMIAQNVCLNDLSFQIRQKTWHHIEVEVTEDLCGEGPYRIAVRSETNDWDSVYFTEQKETEIELAPGKTYFISMARVNGDGIESLFTNEQFKQLLNVEEEKKKSGVTLLQNKPNPFDESTIISFIVHDEAARYAASIEVVDMQGALVETIPVNVQPRLNEVTYNHGFGQEGTFVYRLILNNAIIDAKKMVFYAN